ncbi:hypothetical protein C8R43DRAFT_73097 [Mycena crocata]|nr:hypothetical protein C8R43DRAFT_73097 [Mycena crocata]
MPPDRATKPKGHRHSPIPKKPIRKIKLLHPLDPQPSSIPCNAPPKEGTRLRYIMDYVLVPTSASVGSGLVYRQPPPDIPASPGGGWSSSDEDEDPTWVPDSPSPPKISEPDRTIPPCSLDATLHSRVSSRVSKLAHSLILMIYDAQILQLFPTWQGFLADIGHRIVAFCNSPADPIFALAIQGRGCGYYGSEGALVIGASILELAYGMDEELPHAIRITVEKALRADTTNHFDGYEPNFSLPLFMSYILIPFVATMLIQEDMKTSITVADAYRREGNTRMETVAAGLEWNELPPEDTVTDICDIEAASYTMVEETNGEALLSYPECESETAASHSTVPYLSRCF